MVCKSEWCYSTGFRGKQRDAALRYMVRPSHGSDSEQEQGDPDVPTEDEEFFETPDADAMEEAISKFVNGLEQQERRGSTAIHTFATLWFSSVPLRCLICPSKVPWKMLEWSRCTNHPLHSVCAWLLACLLPRTWSAESP